LTNSFRNTTFTATTLALLASSLISSGALAGTQRLSAHSSRNGIRLVSTKASPSSRKPKPGTGAVSSKGLTERGEGAAPVSTDRLNGPAKGTSAKTPSSGSTSGSNTASTKPAWAQKLSASLLVSVDGPTLNVLDDRKAAVKAINNQNFLNLGYQIGNGWSTSGTFDFAFSPGSRAVSLMDPFVSLKKSGIVDKNGYKLNAQGRIYGALSPRSQSANLLGLSRLTVEQNYTTARWTVGLSTYAQGYFYNSYREANSTRMKYLAEPSLSYQVSPTFAASLAYDMEMRNRHEHGWADFSDQASYLIPSVSWSPNAWFSLEPSLILTPRTRIATDTTMVNVTAMFSLL
jgi:hypothetical protein